MIRCVESVSIQVRCREYSIVRPGKHSIKGVLETGPEDWNRNCDAACSMDMCRAKYLKNLPPSRLDKIKIATTRRLRNKYYVDSNTLLFSRSLICADLRDYYAVVFGNRGLSQNIVSVQKAREKHNNDCDMNTHKSQATVRQQSDNSQATAQDSHQFSTS